MKVEKLILCVSLFITIVILTLVTSSVYYLTINRNRIYDLAKEVMSYGIRNDVEQHDKITKVEFDGDTIWKYTPTIIDTKRVIFMVPGGAFLTCQPNVDTLEKLNLPYVTYIITYPVLPSSFNDALNATIKAFTHLQKMVTGKITVLSISAGSLLSVLTINRVVGTFEKLVTVSGYFGYASISDYLVKFADLFWLRGPLSRPINAEPISPDVKLLVLASLDDKRLGESSEFFAKLNTTQVNWFSGGHDFWNLQDLPDTKLAYALVTNFIQHD